MDVGRKVVDVLSMAVQRLDEPTVLAAYRQLIELIDFYLGGELAGGRARPLTEPQLVLISYGLKHLQSPDATALLRAVQRLEAALNGEPGTSLISPVEEMPKHTPQAFAPAPPPTQINRIRQKIGVIKGGNVTVIGQQAVNAAPQAMPQPEAEADDAGETSELAAVRADTKPIVSDVFISYSRRNADLMRRLRADLRASGMSVWTDENLTPGKPSWQRAVHAAIRGARTMVVLMTPDSKESEWVEHEISAAHGIRVPIFPVLARGNAKSAIPFALNTYQYVDIRNQGDYRQATVKLIKALRTEIKQRS
jgi:hypothetical protein